MTAEIADRDVAAVFGSYPETIAAELLAIRELIFETARLTPGIGPLTEALRWGQPSYLTAAPRTGTMIRLGWHPARPGAWSVFVHCGTSLIGSAGALYPGLFQLVGKREIRFDDRHPVPATELSHIITLALTYHL
jgi:Domain of unknown function (DU1801)